jgi:two-component system phosphate regulon sensor histidine kinase PhoR
VAEKTHLAALVRDLSDKCRILALVGDDLSQSTVHEIAKAAGGRVTLIARDGSVLIDSEARPDQMENHRDRPEVQAAFAGREGYSVRASPTMGIRFMYVAVPVKAGALRLAVPLSMIDDQTNEIRRQMLASTALAFLPAVLVAALIARRVSGRLGAIIEYAAELARGNFQARIARPGRGELGMLASRLVETGDKLRQAVEQLERDHAELEKTERVRKDFVINVSHELRTPLASIQGYTETLLDGALDDPQHNVRFLSIIRANAERLRRLTEDLLTLSQIELKRRNFQPASYYVNVLLEEAVDSFVPMADKKQITIEFFQAPADVEVFCDAEAVQQIMGNLLENAIKYTPEGGRIEVAATTNASSKGGPAVRIEVRDTGIGIPADDLTRVFERFYRVDKARSRELGGTGLGLAIVKHLVRAQGGEVQVESRVNQGSNFSFTVPILDLGAQEHPTVQSELTIS